MNIVKNITTKTSVKCPYAMTPTRIVVHNTANDASARNEIAYMNSNNNQTSFHYAVDDVEVVQGIEENRNSWNAGDGANGKGNRQGIAIEICYSKSGGDRFTKAEANAVELIVDILKRYGWGIDKVTKHQYYSGKYCPHRTLDMGWQRFLNMIKEELIMRDEIEDLKRRVSALENGQVVAPKVEVPVVEAQKPITSEIKTGDRVVLSNNATVYQGASKGVKIPSSVKGKSYTVQSISRDGKTVLLKEIVSWVLKSEVSK